MIECRTVIGFGAPTKAGTAASHGAPLGADEIAGTREGLGWPHAPFTVPDPILAAWRTVGERGRDARAAWEARRAALDEGRRGEFDAAVAGDLPAGLSEALAGLKRSFADEGPTIATRVANQRVIAAIADALPCLIGGSADLTGSNGTKTDALVPIAPATTAAATSISACASTPWAR